MMCAANDMLFSYAALVPLQSWQVNQSALDRHQQRPLGGEFGSTMATSTPPQAARVCLARAPSRVFRSVESCGASLRRADEGVCPYMIHEQIPCSRPCILREFQVRWRLHRARLV